MPNSTVRIQTKYGVFRTWDNDLFAHQLRKFSAHTRNELAMLRSVIRPGDRIIDIGAHVGTFAIPFSRFVGNDGRIWAIEAHPENYELLVSNIEDNDRLEVICPVHAVVGNEASEYEVCSGVGNSGTHYCKPANNDSSNLVVRSIQIDKWHQAYNGRVQIDLIKIDVEGMELACLQSCQEIIQVMHPMLYVEVNEGALKRYQTRKEDLEAFLLANGYRFLTNAGLRNSSHDEFRMKTIRNLNEMGRFFDVLAIHKTSDRI